MRYLIWTQNYGHAGGGHKVLHRLCHELNQVGQRALVNHAVTNPEWDTPYHRAPLSGDWVAVYPEVVRGNPWRARRVARWVLNVPGKLGGDRTYDPSELVFSWDPSFLAGVPLLHLPAVETDIYSDRGLPRQGEVFYVGKGELDASRVNGATAITVAMRQDRHALADALNRAELLRCFDDCTAMTEIARLCGCPALVIPTGERLEPDGFRDEYLAQWPVFRKQLAAFVRITQG